MTEPRGWIYTTSRDMTLAPDNSPLDTATFASYPGGGDPKRLERPLAGIRGAIRSGIDLSSFNVFVVVCNHTPGDSFGTSGYIPVLGRNVGVAFLDANGWFTANGSHELGHALGLGHSFGPYAKPGDRGEYGDPWDLMSAHACFEAPSGIAANGNVAPGLNAPNLLLQDWVPEGRVE